MASGGVRVPVEQLTCSICLEVFCSPVTLPCAHSFCRGCIQTCWDKGDISCPLCLTRFPQRPALSVNLIMESLASDLRPDEPEPPAAAEQVDAQKGPLLQPDDDEDVTQNPGKQNKVMCSQHKEDELSLFCLQDNTLMCEKCAAQHKTHITVPAVEQIPQIKKMLRNEKILTTNSTHNVKVDILKAQMNMETFKESSKFQKEELEVDFSRLISTINDVKGRLMASMDEKEKKLLQKTESQVAKMEATCRSLEDKMSNIDAGMKSTDPCVVLQACSSLQSSLSHAPKLQSSDDAALDPEEKLTESSDIREQLITAVTAIWKESKFPRTIRTVVAKALDIDFFTSTSVKLSELDRFKESLTFDLTTAGCFIWVSLDKTMAMNSNPIKQPYETTLGRLSSYFVRASQSFTGGRHFWRVSFPTRPAYFGMKNGDMSWCVEIETEIEIKVICSSEKLATKYRKDSNYTSFGVYLDYESGILCLYGLRGYYAHLLYSFITSFGKQVLFPVFKVADNTHVKLS